MESFENLWTRVRFINVHVFLCPQKEEESDKEVKGHDVEEDRVVAPAFTQAEVTAVADTGESARWTHILVTFYLLKRHNVFAGIDKMKKSTVDWHSF